MIKSKKGAIINGASEFDDESRVMFLMNHMFLVKAIDKSNDSYIIFINEIPEVDMNKQREKYWGEPISFSKVVCSDCKFLVIDEDRALLSCPAFPEGLPAEVLRNKHTDVLPNQVGDYVFSPKEDK